MIPLAIILGIGLIYYYVYVIIILCDDMCGFENKKEFITWLIPFYGLIKPIIDNWKELK